LNPSVNDNCKNYGEKYYVLRGCFSYVCKNPKDRYVYDECEIKSSKIQKYIKNHRYDCILCRAIVQDFELKKWSIDDIVKLEEVEGGSPRYLFENNGFNLLRRIDIIDLFDHPKIERHKLKNGKFYHAIKVSDINFGAVYDLAEKKKEIQSILDKLDYKNKNLIIYRTLARRGYHGHWDFVDIFEKSNATKLKFFYRLKINLQSLYEKNNTFKQTIKFKIKKIIHTYFYRRLICR